MLFVSGALVTQLDLVVGIHDAPTSALTEEALPGYDLSKELPRKKKSSKPRCLGSGLNYGTVPGIHPRFLYQGDTRLRHSGEVGPCVLWLELQPDLAVDRCCHGGLVLRLKELQRLFTAPLAQYFATISFTFYIVHGPLIHSPGHAMVSEVFSITRNNTSNL